MTPEFPTYSLWLIASPSMVVTMLCERGIHDLAGDALLFVEKDRHKLFGTAIAFSSNKLSDGEEGGGIENRKSELGSRPVFPVVNFACSLCRRR